MEIICATNNQHKAREFNRIFNGHRIILPGDLGVSFSYEETGATFLENAFGKANTLYSIVHKPVIADDSGLCVEALEGGPGVYSARYGAGPEGKELSADERNELLLSRMQNKTNRKAFFVCCMVLILDTYRFYIAQETFPGVITDSPRGERGFGYDPVFFVPSRGKTAAELSDSEKDELSHRGKAARKLFQFLD